MFKSHNEGWKTETSYNSQLRYHGQLPVFGNRADGVDGRQVHSYGTTIEMFLYSKWTK